MIGKFGLRPDPRDPRNLKLSNYIDPDRLPPPPLYREWSPAVGRWEMYGNDRYGCCVFAAAAHMIQTWTAADGAYRPVSTADVLAAYSAVEGFDPDDPSTDNGSTLAACLKHWRREGIGGHKIEAFLEVDPRNHRQRALAMEMFGCLFGGFGLPSTIWSESLWADTTGEPWSAGGHAMATPNYGPHVLAPVSWAGLRRATPEWFDRYCDSAYVVLPERDWTGADYIAPNGLDLGRLRADIARVTA